VELLSKNASVRRAEPIDYALPKSLGPWFPEPLDFGKTAAAKH